MNETLIKSVTARQVYTNRGKPGVEVVVITENGAEGRAMCTSGVSMGTHEVEFTFDGGKKFGGKGVTGAAKRVEESIAPVIIGIRKINFGTDVCCSFIEGYKCLDPYSAPLDVVMAKASESVKEFALEKIKLLGADRI